MNKWEKLKIVLKVKIEWAQWHTDCDFNFWKKDGFRDYLYSYKMWEERTKTLIAAYDEMIAIESEVKD